MLHLYTLALPGLWRWWLRDTCRVVGPAAEVDSILRLSDNHCEDLGVLIDVQNVNLGRQNPTAMRPSSRIGERSRRGCKGEGSPCRIACDAVEAMTLSNLGLSGNRCRRAEWRHRMRPQGRNPLMVADAREAGSYGEAR